MKKKSTRLKELREDLNIWQTWYRIELNGLKRTKERIKKVAAEMRKVQKETGK